MNYLKEYRLSANMNQAQLAEKLCVTQACVSRWEHGIAYPEVETAKKISKLLGIPFDLIFNLPSHVESHTLPVYDSITADGMSRSSSKAGSLLELSEREMKMLLPRSDQKLVKSGKERQLVLEPERFFGFYYNESDMFPYIMKDSLNVIFSTTNLYPNAMLLVSLDGKDASIVRLVDGESDIVVITNNNPVQYRHFRVSDLTDGNLKIHGVVVQSRTNYLF